MRNLPLFALIAAVGLLHRSIPAAMASPDPTITPAPSPLFQQQSPELFGSPAPPLPIQPQSPIEGQSSLSPQPSREAQAQILNSTLDFLEGVDTGLNSEASLITSRSTIPLSSSVDRFDIRVEPGQRWAVVGLLNDQTVQLLDLDTGEPLWSLPIGFAPAIVRIDPNRLLVYASGPNAPGLVVIDLRTGELVRAYGLAAGVFDLDFDPQTGRIFASMPSAQSVAVIPLDQEQALNLPLSDVPLAVAYDSSRGRLLVSLASDDPLSLLVLDPNNGEMLSRWRSGSTPEDMILDPEGQRLVLLNSASQDLTLIDLTSNGGQVTSIGLDWRPTRLALSKDGRWAYVTSRDSSRLQIVDLNTAQLEATVDLGDQPTGIMALPTFEPSNALTESRLLVVEAGIPQLHELSIRWMSLMNAPETLISAGGQMGAITGQVLDLAGNPVTQGTLRIAPAPGFVGQTLELDAEGRYLITDLPQGIYLADVEVPNFPPITTQLQIRAGFVSTQDLQLPPANPATTATGIGLLPDVPTFSDELARHLEPALEELEPDRQVLLLAGPLGPTPEFESLAPLAQGLSILDRDERYTEDLAKLKVIGSTLGLRYILLTQMQTSMNYNTQGSPLLNTAVRFLAPIVPVEIPNFTPNQLRSRGLVVVVDLKSDQPGDQARYYEAYGRDDVGGQPMFEDAAAGLFRLQVRNMVPDFVEQWQATPPFADS